MSLRFVPRCFGLVLLLVSSAVLIWGLKSVAYEALTVPVSQSDLDPSKPGGVNEAVDEKSISGQLILKWPRTLRLGDAGEVRLTFSPNTLHQDDQTADRILHSHLDLAGFLYTPTGVISQALTMDHPVTFLWNLRSSQIGKFTGDVWLYVQNGLLSEGKNDRKVVVSQQFESSVITLLGMGGLQARILGSIGVVAGAVLGAGEWANKVFETMLQKQSRKDDLDA